MKLKWSFRYPNENHFLAKISNPKGRDGANMWVDSLQKKKDTKM